MRGVQVLQGNGESGGAWMKVLLSRFVPLSLVGAASRSRFLQKISSLPITFEHLACLSRSPNIPNLLLCVSLALSGQLRTGSEVGFLASEKFLVQRECESFELVRRIFPANSLSSDLA